MSSLLKNTFYRQVIKHCSERGDPDFRESISGAIKRTSLNHVLEQAVQVTTLLREHPYLTAREIAQKTDISLESIAVIYRLIKSSGSIQDYLRQADNRDYFNVVNHYFNKRQFTIVFFIGTSCPCRCIFCPSVHVEDSGTRVLFDYGNQAKSLLKPNHIAKVFRDLKSFKDNGTDVLVKISGGLEPLTEIETVSCIAAFSSDAGFTTKLLTNGVLLNTKRKRRIALKSSDIRISLCTTDETQYQNICIGETKHSKPILRNLIQSIRDLVKERTAVNPLCKIGFNSVIIPSNLEQPKKLIDLALDIGLDYIDFKPDYFSKYDDETEQRLQEAVNNATAYSKSIDVGDLYINFAGSLSRKNLFWESKTGACDTTKQSIFKIFVTPFGQCTPIHYGAFPHSASSENSAPSPYMIGQISDSRGLSDILEHPATCPQIPIEHLNPFELILGLEIHRQEEDKLSGIPNSCNPYLMAKRHPFQAK